MFGLTKYGNGIGLHRILAFCAYAQIDLDRLSDRSLVVTGSRGKGSTARFVYAGLRAHFAKVGCFTSPHLFDVRERFEVSGEQIPQELFAEYVARVQAFGEELHKRGDALGEFELLFCVALLWFHEQKVDCVVWEAGIGGRYDPVRVLQAPLSVLTFVELEHTELLGGTKELIAYDKLDATRSGGTTIISPAVDQSLRERIQAFGVVSSRNFTFVSDHANVQDVTYTPGGMTYRSTLSLDDHAVTRDITIPLVGMHQVHNSLTALFACSDFVAKRGETFSVDACIQAWRTLTWPGRMEKVASDPDMWIDVGHSPEAVAAVADEFAHLFPPEKTLVVLGVSTNKRIAEIVAAVESRFSHILLTSAYKNGTPAPDVARYITDPSHICGMAETIEEAVSLARTLAQKHHYTVIVLGGLFLAIEFAHALRGDDPKELIFF